MQIWLKTAPLWPLAPSCQAAKNLKIAKFIVQNPAQKTTAKNIS
jgi:hypothetical protein